MADLDGSTYNVGFGFQFLVQMTWMICLPFLLMQFMDGWALLIFWVEIIMQDLTNVLVGATYLKFKSSVIKFILTNL